ncbi:MAG: hypothetical protein J4G09_10180 [Proteobacteria bacterium]|nr:hypothetical protein [Pseudomonadota bacterium]
MPTLPLRVLTHVPPAVLARVSEARPDVEWVEVPQEGPAPKGVSGEILLTAAWGSPNLGELVRAAGVRWIHTVGTGVDRFPMDQVGDRVLTCARGASAIPISEWVLAVILALEKALPDTWIDRPPERWNAGELGGVYGQTLGLVGIGGIGVAIAERALPFGMRVLALRRTSQPSPVDGVEIVASLAELLARSDHLVIAAAATPRTRHLIDAEALGQVKPGVHLINIARGSLIDQDALREALDDGRIARASLDVCEPEPLPEDHWLYRHPRVRLSPHCSWIAPGALDRLFDTFVDNLGRWERDDPLTGQVDLKQRY